MSNARKLSKLVVGTEVKATGVDSDLSNTISSLKTRLDSDDAAIQALSITAAALTPSGLTDSDLKVVADLRSQLDSEILSSRSLSLDYTNYIYTATAGQTTFTGSDDNSATLSYTAGTIQVFLNGILLDGSDYTATSGTSIVLNEAAALNNELAIIVPRIHSTYSPAVPDVVYNWETQVRNPEGLVWPEGQIATRFGAGCDISADGTYVCAVHGTKDGNGDSDTGVVLVFVGTGDSDGGSQDYNLTQIINDSEGPAVTGGSESGGIKFNRGTDSVPSATYMIAGAPRKDNNVGGFIVYKRTGDTFNEVSRLRVKDDFPSQSSGFFGGGRDGVAVSADAKFVAIQSYNGAKHIVYIKNDNDDEYTACTAITEIAPSGQGGSAGNKDQWGGIYFSDDASYLATGQGIIGQTEGTKVGEVNVWKKDEDSDGGTGQGFTLVLSKDGTNGSTQIAPHRGYEANGGFGKSIQFNNDASIMAIGGGYPGGNSDARGRGFVEIWKRSGETWSRQQVIDGGHTIFNSSYYYSNFGNSISFDKTGENMIVGAPDVVISDTGDVFGSSSYNSYNGPQGSAGYVYSYRKRDSDNGFEFEPANVFRHGLEATGQTKYFSDEFAGNSGGVYADGSVRDSSSTYGKTVRLSQNGQYCLVNAPRFGAVPPRTGQYGRLFVSKATGTPGTYT